MHSFKTKEKMRLSHQSLNESTFRVAKSDEWRPIASSNYAVSRGGQVKRIFPVYSVGCLGNAKVLRKRYQGRTLSQHKFGSQYLTVRLWSNGKQKEKYVHQLVADAYLPPRPTPRHEIDHIDRNKQNNSSDNLRWATKSQNLTGNVCHRISKEERYLIHGFLNAGKSQIWIAKHFGISQPSVSNISKEPISNTGYPTIDALINLNLLPH